MHPQTWIHNRLGYAWFMGKRRPVIKMYHFLRQLIWVIYQCRFACSSGITGVVLTVDKVQVLG
jgi:hypothetical protein